MEKVVNGDYLTEFFSHLSQDQKQLLIDRAASRTGVINASLHSRSGSKRLYLDNIPSFQQLIYDGLDHVVVLVENISLPGIEAIGRSFGIEPSFLADHVCGPNLASSSPWRHVFGTTPLAKKQMAAKEVDLADIQHTSWVQAETWHVDGVAISNRDRHRLDAHLLPRAVSVDDYYGVNTLSRFSAWFSRNASLRLYLLLVDGPVHLSPAPSVVSLRPRLRLPLSQNRGGLVLPQLYDAELFSVYECFQKFLSHTWHYNALFPPSKRMLDPYCFFYLMVTSTWEYNYRCLDRDIKHIAFEEIRRPTTAINDKLHDLRHNLDFLDGEVETMLIWMPKKITQTLEKIQESAEQHSLPNSHISFPGPVLEHIRSRAETLGKFLMDSFTLLLSSISVAEAERSARQSDRVQKLTTLAFLYVPLTFVTGVFGMNIQQINGSPLSIWVPIVCLAVCLILTALAVVLSAQWQRMSVYTKLKTHMTTITR